MARHVPIIMILIALLLLAGCGTSKDQDTTPGAFSATGSKGITIKMLNNQPPPTVYTGTGIDFAVEVRNEGTASVDNVQLQISGYDSNIIPISSPRQTLSGLEGKSEFNTIGDFDNIVFSSSPVQLQNGVTEYTPTFLVSACYAYQTKANPIVCIDPQPTNQYVDRSCTPGPVSTGTQGAPIAVTGVEQETTPTNIFFRINIANVGGGVVYDKGALGNCPDALTYKDFDLIGYQVQLAQGRLQPECKPASPVRLVNGRATIFCKFPQDSNAGSTYETPLNVLLDYGYKDTISKQVKIKNIAE